MPELIPAIPYGYTQTWDPTKTGRWDIYGVKRGLTSPEPDVTRVALVGLGGIAQARHLPAIKRLQSVGVGIQIAGVADIDRDTVNKVAREYGAPAYTNAWDLLKEERPDAAIVMTPPSEDRFEIVGRYLTEGVHVLAEKPLLFYGLDRQEEALRDARQLCSVSEERGLVFMTGFMRRYSAAYGNARSFIDQGVIGQPSTLFAKMSQAWAATRLLEAQACHVIDVARFLVGEIASVHATHTNRYGVKDYPADNIVLTFRYESGAIGALYTSSSGQTLKPWERVEVHGDHRWMVVEDGLDLVVYDSEEGPEKRWRPALPNTMLFDVEFYGFAGEIANFVRSVRRVEVPLVSGWDGVRAMEIAFAAHEAMKTGEWVALPSPNPAGRR